VTAPSEAWERLKVAATEMDSAYKMMWVRDQLEDGCRVDVAWKALRSALAAVEKEPKVDLVLLNMRPEFADYPSSENWMIWAERPIPENPKEPTNAEPSLHLTRQDMENLKAWFSEFLDDVTEVREADGRGAR
jgi:hypothetical protein